MPGPAPKKASQRRRANKPKSYGAADAVVAGQAVAPPPLGIDDCHQMVVDLYEALSTSVEGKFFSAADWQRARLECFYINSTIARGRPGAQAWAAVQSGLGALLVSPADKRRIGIELNKATTDPDEDAAVASLDEYRRQLGG
ncbi:hypothetical protein [Gordonia sp. (in: high G+C Gram-positive bacteria)]|uniref:phage terminase small subunit n=1 Tax=Gordonia sp. (in: high G+C Gram-positive bacteria) TaxID=84139 RepID=UPI0039E368BA